MARGIPEREGLGVSLTADAGLVVERALIAGGLGSEVAGSGDLTIIAVLGMEFQYVGQSLVVSPRGYGGPRLGITLEEHRLGGSSRKGVISQRGQGGGKHHRVQGGTAPEGFAPHSRHTLGQDHLGKALTAVEGTLSYLGEACGQLDARQGAAPVKDVGGKDLQTVGKGHLGQVEAVHEGVLAQRGNALLHGDGGDGDGGVEPQGEIQGGVIADGALTRNGQLTRVGVQHPAGVFTADTL